MSTISFISIVSHKDLLMMKATNKVLKNIYENSLVVLEGFIDRCACIFFSLYYNNSKIDHTKPPALQLTGQPTHCQLLWARPLGYCPEMKCKPRWLSERGRRAPRLLTSLPHRAQFRGPQSQGGASGQCQSSSWRGLGDPANASPWHGLVQSSPWPIMAKYTWPKQTKSCFPENINDPAIAEQERLQLAPLPLFYPEFNFTATSTNSSKVAVSATGTYPCSQSPLLSP